MIVYLNSNPAWLSVRLKDSRNLSRDLAGITTILKQLDPDTPPTIQFADENFGRKYHDQQLLGTLSTIFGSLAIFVSCLGLLGLALFAAELRTKEIGVRKVLGARPWQLAGLLSADFLKWVAVSALIALPLGGWVMQHWLEQFDYRMTLHWWIFPGAALAALTVAGMTVALQALRAAAADPVKSLRSE